MLAVHRALVRGVLLPAAGWSLAGRVGRCPPGCWCQGPWRGNVSLYFFSLTREELLLYTHLNLTFRYFTKKRKFTECWHYLRPTTDSFSTLWNYVSVVIFLFFRNICWPGRGFCKIMIQRLAVYDFFSSLSFFILSLWTKDFFFHTNKKISIVFFII